MKKEELTKALSDLEISCGQMVQVDPESESWKMAVVAVEEMQDVLYDYGLLAEQLSIMIKKYETEHEPIFASGVYVCPECHHRVRNYNTHCVHCGAMIGWIRNRRTLRTK